MGLATTLKNVMLDAAAAVVTHVGILRADAGKAVTGVAATDILTSAGHGYANGDVVLFSAMTRGDGLVALRMYFVINQTANTFQVANVAGGAAVDFTADLTAGTVTRIVEWTGGAPAYARRAIAFNRASEGIADDSTNGAVIDAPPGSTNDWIGLFDRLAGGNLQSIGPPSTVENFVGQGQCVVNDADLDMMTALVA